MDNDSKFKIDLLEQNVSNETAPTSNKQPNISKKKIFLMASPIVLIIALVVIIKIKYSFFNNVKKKVVASQYKCETNYKLKNKKCILTKEQSPVLLGNVNRDQSVDQTDVDVLELLIDTSDFDDLSYTASDINRDGMVDGTDLKLLTSYVQDKINEYDIGIQKVCPMDTDDTLYYLNKKQDKCIQVIAKDASKKNEKEVQLEEVDNNTGSYNSNSGNNSNNVYQTSTVITRYSNTVSEPTYDGSTVPYYNYSPYPSTHAYNYPSYSTSSVPSYNTQYDTSNYYNTNYYPETPIYEEQVVEKNKSMILYSKDSLIALKEIKTPDKDTEYNLQDNLDIELDVNQKGSGFYYYDVKTYYSSNEYNNGYLNTISTCQKLKTNSIKELSFKVVSDNNRLIFTVYADKDCREQTAKSKYISSIYSAKSDTKQTKLTEKKYTINKDFKLFVLKPVEETTNYNYRIRYSISDGKNYYTKENKECLKVVNGMNQLKTNTNNTLDIYSDKKCSKKIKTIKLDK